MSGVEGVDKALGQAVEDIGGYIRRQRESAQVSMRQLAKVAGISNPYLSQIERGLRKPSAEILSQIATGLRISAEVLYVRAGFLEQRQGSAVLDSLACDPDLTDRQKQVLHDIYESFRRENRAAGTSGETSPGSTTTSPAGSGSGATDGTAALAVAPDLTRLTTDQE
ncbi:helix-turn-helix domain-containing protein [Actinomycetospora endophytica]|uniref:Helix-turn-helix domain-containing protein n=1 Tax=Actinomycetospora endophytica TaxID=2291215 RepID=A0ABS8PBR6_9PSEU|nr:helix-turn-helix transcriptional regulator [Actinomycetospora endophytica]MCD2195663.1 helix-turn-helix domain-containing protein [Actinomycetospora endophytica]